MTLTRALPLPILAGLAAVTLLAACETVAPALPPPPPPPPPPPVASGAAPVFRAQDFAWATNPGAGRINGHLAYGRGQFNCSAGALLMPETAFVRARMVTMYGATSGAELPTAQVRTRTPPAPAGFAANVRSTGCDAQNRFTFAGIPNGAWYVVAVARPVSGKGEEMAIMRRVVISEGRAVALEL